MLFALEKLGYLNLGLNENKSELHRALVESFGDFGERASISYNIGIMNKPNAEHKRKIELCRKEIESQMKFISDSTLPTI